MISMQFNRSTLINFGLTRRFHTIIPLLVVLSFVQPATAADKPDTIAKPVKLLTVASNTTGAQRTFFGRVSAKQTVDLAFQVGGQLVDFPAIEGNVISAGSLVAKLDLEPFELALDSANASMQQADRNLKRLEQLRDNTSRARIDDAKTARTIARIAVRDAQYALDHATLIAPFDAVVASRTAANFATVAAGTPIVRLHDLSELHIEIEVPEIMVQRIGNTPNVELVARFPSNSQDFPLEFREINAEASRIGQTFTVTLGMAPPENMLLLPGASVSVKATLRDQPASITIPATAIVKGSDHSVSVMRFDDSGEQAKLVKTPVTLKVSESGEFQVVEGISSGDEIVIAGVDSLTDGQVVRRFVSF